MSVSGMHPPDGYETDSDDEREFLRQKSFRKLRAFYALEEGALHMSPVQYQSPGIAGRMGNSITFSSRESAFADEENARFANDGTPLVGRKMGAPQSPPVVQWIIPALCCAASYAFYNVYIKKGSFTIFPMLGAVILQLTAAILGTLLLVTIILTDKGNAAHIHYDRSGIFWSCAAGLAVGCAEMMSFVVSGMGVPVSQSIPVIIGGSVLFGAILGMVLLGEKMMFHGWSGIAFLVFGIIMVSTDPGDKVMEGGVKENDIGPPRLLIWIGPALITASCYAFYNIFIKLGSTSINPILGGVLLQFVSASFGSVLLAVMIWWEGGTKFLFFDFMGIVNSCFAGVAVGTAEMLSFCVSGMGVIVSQSIPVIIGGSVGIGAVLGLIMLGESMMYQGWCGVLILMTGIGFVATDPGAKVAGH